MEDVLISLTTKSPLPPLSKEDRERFYEVKITNEEFSDWCKPWKGSLMVILLGKKIGFCMMETKLNIVWARKGSIKIIDVPRNYFQVLFTFDEEYNHPLMEEP